MNIRIFQIYFIIERESIININALPSKHVFESSIVEESKFFLENGKNENTGNDDEEFVSDACKQSRLEEIKLVSFRAVSRRHA